jgi:hypothetical protein
MPVVPDAPEAEMRGSHEPRTSARATYGESVSKKLHI